jgi:hypothetical protein
LEDLLPKDNEKVPLNEVELLEPAEREGFTAEQMVRCEECLRANPPTRVSCLYCAAVLPVTEKTSQLQKPALRQLESWETGFNTILVGRSKQDQSDETLAAAGALIKLTPDELQRVISAERPLPLARAASEDEAALIVRRLDELGLKTIVIPDEQLRFDGQTIRIRSATIDEDSITGYHLSGAEGTRLFWSEIVLLVTGRLLVKRVEVKERKSRRAEDDIVAASQFFTDESVLEIYARSSTPALRIQAGGFDFSSLGSRKALVAGENLEALIDLIREKAPHAELDTSYSALRQTLEPVWRAEQRTEASGWRRERPGRYSTSGVTEVSNENQFVRYSRLLYYLKVISVPPL